MPSIILVTNQPAMVNQRGCLYEFTFSLLLATKIITKAKGNTMPLMAPAATKSLTGLPNTKKVNKESIKNAT